MSMRVHVHAAIWVGDRLVVHRRTQRGGNHVSLPGGRVREREFVADALAREVDEEIGATIEIGEMLLAGEVQGVSRHDLVLVFAAALARDTRPDNLELIDPAGSAATEVMPPVIGLLAGTRSAPPGGAAWIGNIYDPQHVAP